MKTFSILLGLFTGIAAANAAVEVTPVQDTLGLTRFDGHLGGGALTESANEQDQDC